MVCAFPPELDEVQLLAHGDGTADPAVAEHLRGCAYCRARADELAQLTRSLGTALYRLDCPTSIELGEYHLELLPPERRLALRSHLHACPHCARELRQLRGFVEALAPDLEPSLVEGVKVLIARLVSGLAPGAAWAPALAPAGAGLRGEEPGVAVYQADGIQITLEVQPDPDSPARRTLLGMAAGLETPGWQVHLRRESRLVASAPLDELGNFHLAGLEPGRYDAVLASAQLEVHLPALEL
jgi:hypothetical protein